MLLRWVGIHKKIRFHATNAREERAIVKYFPGSHIIIADNLPNTMQPAFVSSPKSPGSLRCIFIARIVPIKNILFLLRLLAGVKRMITLTIVGPVEDENYWMECEKMIRQLPVEIQVNYAGPRQNPELPALLQQHHLFVLPTTGENFGHAIFEALLAGRPVLISDQTPWLDLNEKKAGWVLPLDNPAKFAAIINELAECSQDDFDQYAKAAWSYANQFIQNPGLTGQYKKLFT